MEKVNQYMAALQTERDLLQEQLAAKDKLICKFKEEVFISFQYKSSLVTFK